RGTTPSESFEIEHPFDLHDAWTPPPARTQLVHEGRLVSDKIPEEATPFPQSGHRDQAALAISNGLPCLLVKDLCIDEPLVKVHSVVALTFGGRHSELRTAVLLHVDRGLDSGPPISLP